MSNGPPVGRCQATHEQSQQLLHQFLQWESKNQHNRNISIVDRQILSKDVRFGAHHGLNSDIAPGPLCATGQTHAPQQTAPLDHVVGAAERNSPSALAVSC